LRCRHDNIPRQPARRPDSRPGDDDLLKKGAPLTDVYLIRIDCKQEDEGENDEDIFEIQAGEYLITWDSPGS
jgi:hypothetical protein